MKTEDLLLHRDINGIRTLKLNRPDQYNALSDQMLNALQNALDEIAQDASVNVMVITGAGKGMFYAQLEKGVQEAYQAAATNMVCNIMTEDAAEGMDAFMQKRKPVWRGK